MTQLQLCNERHQGIKSSLRILWTCLFFFAGGGTAGLWTCLTNSSDAKAIAVETKRDMDLKFDQIITILRSK